MLAELRQAVYRANMALVRHGLVTFTWGNVSGIDRASGLVAIKPSGVEYDQLSPECMVLVDLEGNVHEGGLRPSSDTPTHLELYKAFPAVGGVVHTHSSYATAWAQAGRPIPPLGTTHADYFYGEIPCARALSPDEIQGDYEANTGRVIIEACTDPAAVPGALVKNHGPFAWGGDADNAVHNAVVIEEVAKMALNTLLINPSAPPAPPALLDKHFLRKHGKNAYYGQK